MKKALTYFSISIAAAAVFTGQPALGQQVVNAVGNGPKLTLVECDSTGKRCQIVRRLRSPAACQNSRVNAALHYRASNFRCVRD